MQKFNVEVKSKNGGYDRSKEFSFIAEMDDHEFLKFCGHIISYFENLENTATILTEEKD